MSEPKRPVELQSARQTAEIDRHIQQGRQAFHDGQFSAAIASWQGMLRHEARIAEALAEAYFRRSLEHIRTEEHDYRIADLQQAISLAPNDPRYQYHLGMALHQAGDIAAASRYYRDVLRQAPDWPAVGMALALAELERNPEVNIAQLPGSTPQILATLAPVRDLLCNTATAYASGEHAALWQGLRHIKDGTATAFAALDTTVPLATTRAETLRRYYQGVAAALAGDIASAFARWQEVYEHKAAPPWVVGNLNASAYQIINAYLEAEDYDQAAPIALYIARRLTNNAAIGGLLARVLDICAHVAIEQRNWEYAAQLWEAARHVLSAQSGLGSPRPLLHNLALAYEHQDRWLQAAETWRMMLRTRKRGKSEIEDLTEVQWEWVRTRVITCYTQAGATDEAVTLFRQTVKTAPKDLEARLQLADALQANDQEQAAINELQRIVQLDPRHIEAQLRLAAIYHARHDWPMAYAILLSVAEQHPDQGNIRRWIASQFLDRANQLYRIGNVTAAIDIYTTGQTLAPDEYQFALGLAYAWLDQNNLEQAQQQLARALELMPAHLSLHGFNRLTDATNIDAMRAVLTRVEEQLSAFSTGEAAGKEAAAARDRSTREATSLSSQQRWGDEDVHMRVFTYWPEPNRKHRPPRLDLTVHHEDVIIIARSYSELERSDWSEHYGVITL